MKSLLKKSQGLQFKSLIRVSCFHASEAHNQSSTTAQVEAQTKGFLDKLDKSNRKKNLELYNVPITEESPRAINNLLAKTPLYYLRLEQSI